jgi:hypothetical protein
MLVIQSNRPATADRAQGRDPTRGDTPVGVTTQVPTLLQRARRLPGQLYTFCGE